MTDQDLTTDGEPVLTLQALIRSRMDEHGWSYAELARRSNDELTKGRWQQLGSGVRLKAFPEPDSMRRMAEALEVDLAAVIWSTAASLFGERIRPRGPDLAQLLPAGTDRLSERMRDAILAITRAAVAEALVQEDDVTAPPRHSDGLLEWPKPGAHASRNTRARSTDHGS